MRVLTPCLHPGAVALLLCAPPFPHTLPPAPLRAVTHVGADLLMRCCYLPDTWGLRVFVCDSRGHSKLGATAEEQQGSDMPEGSMCGKRAGWVITDVAGPLCFQGDRPTVAKNLPLTEPGDYIVVADTGAYTMSMYSR